MRIETVNLSDISQDPANVRKHSERNIEAIVASLRAFGQQKVIVVDSRGIILAGNGTYEAAKRLGWETIEIHRTELSGHSAAAFAIADNRTAELAVWDTDELKKSFESIRMIDEEMALTTGFTIAEIDVLGGEWESDYEPIEKDGETLDGIKATIRIKVDQEAEETAVEAIKKILDENGIDYEI